MARSLYNLRGGHCPHCGGRLVESSTDGCPDCGRRTDDSPVRREPRRVVRAAAAVSPGQRVPISWRVIATVHRAVASLLFLFGAIAVGLTSALLMVSLFGSLAALMTMMAVGANPVAPGSVSGVTMMLPIPDLFLFGAVWGLHLFGWLALINGAALYVTSIGLRSGRTWGLAGTTAVLVPWLLGAALIARSAFAHGIYGTSAAALFIALYCLTAAIVLWSNRA